jgi:hypothetical protein
LIVSEDNYQTQSDGRMAAVSPALNTSHVVTEGSPNAGYIKVLSRTTVVHGIFSEYLARSFFEEQFSDSRPTIKTATRAKHEYGGIAHEGAPGNAVNGAVYHVEIAEHGERLVSYGTDSYRADPCRINYNDGNEPVDDFGYVLNLSAMLET